MDKQGQWVVVMVDQSRGLVGVGLCIVAALAAGCSGSPSHESDGEASPSPEVFTTVATCEPGTDPDRAGPIDQERPGDASNAGGWIPAAMDVHSGSVLTFDGSQTWAFDVCTNTWRRAAPAVELDDQIRTRFAYDADDRVVVAVRYDLREEPAVWAYSVATNTWTKQPPSATEAPPDASYLTDLAYDPVSGDVLARDSQTGELWAYDVGQNAWAKRPRGDTSPNGHPDIHDLLAVDSRAGVVVYVALGLKTWTYDLEKRTWAERASWSPTPNTGFFESGGEIAYDAAAGLTVIFSDGAVAAYSATPSRWTVRAPGPGWPKDAYVPVRQGGPRDAGPLARLGHTMVYDPINERLIILGGQSRMPTGWQSLGDVWAYDVRTNTWIPLLAPRE